MWKKWLINEEWALLGALYDEIENERTTEHRRGELYRESVEVLENAFVRQTIEKEKCDVEKTEHDDEDFTDSCGMGFFGATIVTCK